MGIGESAAISDITYSLLPFLDFITPSARPLPTLFDPAAVATLFLRRQRRMRRCPPGWPYAALLLSVALRYIVFNCALCCTSQCRGTSFWSIRSRWTCNFASVACLTHAYRQHQPHALPFRRRPLSVCLAEVRRKRTKNYLNPTDSYSASLGRKPVLFLTADLRKYSFLVLP